MPYESGFLRGTGKNDAIYVRTTDRNTIEVSAMDDVGSPASSAELTAETAYGLIDALKYALIFIGEPV